jgi:hypothetical protein
VDPARILSHDKGYTAFVAAGSSGALSFPRRLISLLAMEAFLASDECFSNATEREGSRWPTRSGDDVYFKRSFVVEQTIKKLIE